MNKKLYVPLMDTTLTKENREEYLQWLKKIQAKTVFIATFQRDALFSPQEKIDEYAKQLGEHVAFFKAHDFNVGIWMESFGFGGPLNDFIAQEMQDEPRITSVSGKVAGDAFCPEGEKYTALSVRRVQAIAKYAKPDMIMLDDEMCLSVRPGLGCFCEKHMRLYEQKFGKAHTREELKELIFTGYNERYRKGWQQVVGDTMRNYCTAMRKALDEVNANIRMGFCTGYTSWDVEGAAAIELAKLLAGNTKPFLRFSGAPYWVVRRRFGAQKLAEVIECTRMQQQWCDGHGIETFCETDSFPRPRYYVPFSVCEALDVALHASGDMGSFKYLFCYDANPSFETGYVTRHLRNQPLYDFIDKHFENKQAVGVKVFDEQRKIKDKHLPLENVDERAIMSGLFSHAASTLGINSIPTTYGNDYDCGIVFGDVVNYVKTFPKKMIIDGTAALLLQERGYDLGISSYKRAVQPTAEKFGNSLPLRYHWGATQYYQMQLKDGIIHESVFVDINGSEYPSSYRCVSNGTEFLVLCIDGETSDGSSHALQSYYRQQQLLDFIGKKYPYIQGQPGVYTLCKDGENERAVLFVNISEDDLFDFDIQLDKTYSSMEMLGAEGELCGDKIVVKSVVPAYGVFAFVLSGEMK